MPYARNQQITYTTLTHCTNGPKISLMFHILTGRRARLKIWYRKVCRFDSDRPHHSNSDPSGRYLNDKGPRRPSDSVVAARSEAARQTRCAPIEWSVAGRSGFCLPAFAALMRAGPPTPFDFRRSLKSNAKAG